MHIQKMSPSISIVTDKAVPAGGAITYTVTCWPDNVMVVCPPQDVFFCESSSPRGENIHHPLTGPPGKTSFFIEARILGRWCIKIIRPLCLVFCGCGVYKLTGEMNKIL